MHRSDVEVTAESGVSGPPPPRPEGGAGAPKTVRVEWLVDAVVRVFLATGLDEAGARSVAESLVDADMRGVASHGTMLVPAYIDRILAGTVTTASCARTVVDAGAIAVLDAANALGQITSDQAMSLAVEKAQSYGVGVVVVREAFHFGGAFRYVMAAAERGCIGIAASNTRPLMPAPGGATPVVGNNPIAFAVPRLGGEPVILDMALSEAALGKIRLAAAEGQSIPPSWATDADGRPTSDASAAIAGLLLPAGGHKGFGLALVIDILTGVLSGGAFGQAVRGLYQTAVPNNCAHFFLALDPSAFGGTEAFSRRVAQLAAEIGESRLAPGTDRILLPGQLEAERHAKAAVQGVTLQPSVLEGLYRSADLIGAELPGEGLPGIGSQAPAPLGVVR